MNADTTAIIIEGDFTHDQEMRILESAPHFADSIKKSRALITESARDWLNHDAGAATFADAVVRNNGQDFMVWLEQAITYHAQGMAVDFILAVEEEDEI
jgi:hypothetical protein